MSMDSLQLSYSSDHTDALQPFKRTSAVEVSVEEESSLTETYCQVRKLHVPGNRVYCLHRRAARMSRSNQFLFIVIL